MYPRDKSYQLSSVVRSVARTMNDAGTYAGGVGSRAAAGEQVCHVNGRVSDCKGMLIRIACGIVGFPVLEICDSNRKVCPKTTRMTLSVSLR